MVRLIAGAILGAIVGGLVGYLGKCNGGSCPFMCTPIGGIVTGAIIGALIVSSIGRRNQPEQPPSVNILHAASAEELNGILQSNRVVVVDFYATWCGPCRRLAGTINQLADNYVGRAAVVKVNVDNARELSKQHGIRSIPDVRLFVDGKESQKLVGLHPAAVYTSAVDSLLK